MGKLLVTNVAVKVFGVLQAGGSSNTHTPFYYIRTVSNQ
jgi:hypothetical protein